MSTSSTSGSKSAKAKAKTGLVMLLAVFAVAVVVIAGIAIWTRAFQDGIYANQALANYELDSNAFQHYAFLEQEEQQKGGAIGETCISPLNLYSRKYHSVCDFKPGNRIAIPSNASNTGRAVCAED